MISNTRSEPSAKAGSILEAAKKSFLAHGFGAVSVDAIAREAQVSKATVYAHFANKEELFGAVIGLECERRFALFSAEELDPNEAGASLRVLGRRFLDLILSPDAVALHRIIVGEVTRFPVLGEVFWNAGPERNLRQIAEFMAAAAAAGSLALDAPRRAAEEFVGLVRGEVQLRRLLCLEEKDGEASVAAAVENAVATFLRAYRRGR